MLALAFLVLLLQIPISMVRGTIEERAARRDAAAFDITNAWGGEQAIVGPRLVVPYVYRFSEDVGDGKRRERATTRLATFLPESLEVDGTLDSEARYRGIFEVPVYRARLAIEGEFAAPDLSQFGAKPEDVQWERARVVVGISDARAIEREVALDLGGEAIAFLPGTEDPDGKRSGIHAPIGERARAGPTRFSIDLALKGSGGIDLVPFAKTTRATLRSSWPDPSFRGAWLPKERDVTEHGFVASWEIPYLGRGYPQAWDSTIDIDDAVAASCFGARLVSPVDEYRMALRSAKYASLFLLLTFGSLWLFEVVGGVRIHSIQYLLVGSAMCVFHLLEIALAEHLGFAVAYAIATALVVGLIYAYGATVLGASRRAALLAAILSALYGYLYVLLRNEDYALLAGALGLFAALAAAMVLTRKVDWYDIRR